MFKSLKNWLNGKIICSRCFRIFDKSEYKDDKFKTRKCKICKSCQVQLKKSIFRPNAIYDSSCCPYCKNSKYKLLFEDPNDHTGNIYRCYRCKKKFAGYQLDKSHIKRPLPRKGKNIALLKCINCSRVFRQDNFKFKASGKCPSCKFYNFELLKYVK